MTDTKYQELLLRYINHSNEKKCVVDKVLENLRGLKPQSKILDIGCGTGVISSAVADLGHAVTALDIKNSFDRSLDPHDRILFIQKDIFSFETDKKFDVIILAYVFWEIPFEKWKSLMDRLFSLLNQGGRIFVIDTINDTPYDNIYVNFNIYGPKKNTDNYWYEFLDSNNFQYKRNFFETSIDAKNPEEMYEILEFFFQSELLYISKKKQFLESFSNKHITLHHSLDVIGKDI